VIARYLFVTTNQPDKLEKMEVLKQGRLMKPPRGRSTSSLFGGNKHQHSKWKVRYVKVFADGRLQYSDDKGNLKGEIDLHGATAGPKVIDGMYNCFEIRLKSGGASDSSSVGEGEAKTVIFSSDSEGDSASWISIITTVANTLVLTRGKASSNNNKTSSPSSSASRLPPRSTSVKLAAAAVDTSAVVKEGRLLKPPRMRRMVTHLHAKPTWLSRVVKVHESKNLHYWAGTKTHTHSKKINPTHSHPPITHTHTRTHTNRGHRRGNARAQGNHQLGGRALHIHDVDGRRGGQLL